jgi:hypothetical protein
MSSCYPRAIGHRRTYRELEGRQAEGWSGLQGRSDDRLHGCCNVNYSLASAFQDSPGEHFRLTSDHVRMRR